MQKKKIKFNVVDVLAIVLIAFLVISAVAFLGRGIGRRSETKIKYVIELSAISADFSSNVKVGDKILTDEGDVTLGTVAAVDFDRYNYVGYSTDGTQVLTPSDDLINLYLTVEADAEEHGNGFTLNGYDILIGKQITLTMPSIFGTGELISVNRA